MNSMHPQKAHEPSTSAPKPASKKATSGAGGRVMRAARGALVALVLTAAPSLALAQGVDVAVTADVYVDTDPSALTDFRDPLTPYGTWVDDSTYGTVWVPNVVIVGSEFAPYQSAGHWELTEEDEWLWVSDYDWGYIPFHYGRWVWITGRGWAWIPGRTYAPAWVSWRVSEYGYIGWAPMAPTWYWYNGAPTSLWVVPPSAFIFCPTTHVFHHHVATYVVHDRHVIRQIGAHSRNYKPAEPSMGGSAHPGAPGGPGGSSAMAPPSSGGKYLKGPSLEEARVPQTAAPKARAPHDARALGFSTRSATAKTRTTFAAPSSPMGLPKRSSHGGGFDGAGSSRPDLRPSAGAVVVPPRVDRDRVPSMRTPPPRPRPEGQPMAPSGGFTQPTVRPSPPESFVPRPSAPSVTPTQPTHRAPAPAQSSAPAPKHSAPSVTSTPSHSTPRAAPTTRSAPSTPSVHSAPSRPSPSRSSSGHPHRR